jgi:hypothetical protein
MFVGKLPAAADQRQQPILSVLRACHQVPIPLSLVFTRQPSVNCLYDGRQCGFPRFSAT